MAGIQPFLAANHSFCAMAARFVRASRASLYNADRIAMMPGAGKQMAGDAQGPSGRILPVRCALPSRVLQERLPPRICTGHTLTLPLRLLLGQAVPYMMQALSTG